jgi:aspartyl-tRNA synthetase
MKRTHHCGQLRLADERQQVALVGWVQTRRDHGGIVFIDLRDREGMTQVVFDPQYNPTSAGASHALRSEFCICVHGRVRRRPEGTVNPKMPTGDIEVIADRLEVFNAAETPPFEISDDTQTSEDLRLQYRYLDLRRPSMFRNLRLRHQVTKAVRDYFDELGFLEVETPMLFKSTPEGAREYLVPSRLFPSKFYALPQSPQQFKQLLMVAGVEKYFQMARCFRDEDLRADRQPEFTQIDVEMSFIDREDIYRTMEGLMARIWKTALGRDIPIPFPRMSFQDAMNRFGSDKPDTRFAMEMVDFTEDFRASGFKVFRTVIEAGGVVKAMNAKGFACATQGQIEALTEAAKSFGAKGLAWIKVEGGKWNSPIVKFFSDAEKAALTAKLKVEEGDLILFAADQWTNACEILGRIRLLCAQYLQQTGKLTIPADRYDFLWVIDFPLLTFDKEQGRWVSSHHPFTAPVAEDAALLDTDTHRVRGQHYDLVLNGSEIGGGSIRIHQPDLQQKVFDVCEIPRDVAESRFGYFIKAFRYGTPPHGGIAFGFDRIMATLVGSPSIRDVIAFPKTAKATDLMTQSPGDVTQRQLKDLHIRVVGDEAKPA